MALLAIVMLAMAQGAFAADDFTYDGLGYKITSQSKLEVELSSAPQQETIVVPETVNYNNRTYMVTGIGISALNGHKTLTKIELPKTIVTIGSGAFSFCSSLTEIQLPESVTSIGSTAFSSCSKLSSIIIPPSVTTIDSYAFEFCSSLTEVFFTSKSKPTIGGNAFYNCHSALERYVPSVTEYGFGIEYISFNETAFTYNGMSPKVTWENNLKAYDVELDVSGLEKTAGTHTATCKATYSRGIDLMVEIPYTYTINPASLSLSVNDCEREYGDANPQFSCVMTGFVEGENAEALSLTPSYSCEANKQSDAGTYRILASMDAKNYEVTYSYGTLTVKKAPIQVSVKDCSKIYGNQNPEFEFAYSGLKNNEMAPQWTTPLVVETTVTKESPCGVYPISVKGGESKNYDAVKYVSGNITITKRDLAVSTNDCARMYGEDNPQFPLSYVGFANNDDEKAITNTPVAVCSATKESNVGKYSIIPSGGVADNYNFIYKESTLTVTKAPLTVKAEDATREEGKENPEFTITYNGWKLNDDESVLTSKPKVTTTATVSSSAGKYPITVSGGAAENYDLSYQNGTLTVTAAPTITVTVVNCKREYGDANPEFTFTVEGGELNGKPAITCEATASSAVGSYPIVINKGSITYPKVNFVNGTLTVTKAPLTVKAENAVRKEFEENPEFTITYNGWKLNDDESVLTSKPTATTTATVNSPAGEYPITVSGGAATNYELSYQNGTLIVTEAPTITVTAVNCKREYGDANPEFTFTVEGGELNGKPTITCEATASSAVGSYSIVINKGSITYPKVNFVNGTLTVTKAPLTVKAENAVRKEFEENPEFTITYNGWKLNDDESVLTSKPTATTTATANSPAGEYPITVSGGTATNYELSYQNGTLIVTEVSAITVIAVSREREYGDANPEFTFTVEGGELNGKPAITCEATEASSVGTYPIVLNMGSITNPKVTLVNGTLTVTKAPLTVKAENAVRKEFEENPEFTITYNGWKLNDDESVLTAKPTATTTATANSPAGEYPITVSGGAATNYELSYQNGTLTIAESTSIGTVSVEHSADIYNLQGKKVRSKATTLKGLPKGVYIINGRKHVVK